MRSPGRQHVLDRFASGRSPCEPVPPHVAEHLFGNCSPRIFVLTFERQARTGIIRESVEQLAQLIRQERQVVECLLAHFDPDKPA